MITLEREQSTETSTGDVCIVLQRAASRRIAKETAPFREHMNKLEREIWKRAKREKPLKEYERELLFEARIRGKNSQNIELTTQEKDHQHFAGIDNYNP